LSDSDVNITKTLTKVTYLGLLWNVLFPVAYVGVAIFLKQRNQADDMSAGFAVAPNIQLLFYLLLGVSFLDLGLAYYFRRMLPRKMIMANRQLNQLSGLSLAEHFNQSATTISLVIFACVGAASLYGLVLVIMGAQLEVMVLFVALSLIGYQLFRPREAFLERVLERVKQIRAEAGRTG
jgi:hypothetical protein